MEPNSDEDHHDHSENPNATFNDFPVSPRRNGWKCYLQNKSDRCTGKNTSNSSTVNPFESFPHLSSLKGRYKRHDDQKGFNSFTQKDQHGIKSVVRSGCIDRRQVPDQGS